MEIGVFGYIDNAVERVGTITTLPTYEEQFSYAGSFLDKHADAQLSLSLPLQEEPFVSRRTRPYFKNLLPEGAALRAIAKKFEVNSSAYLQILSRLGDECIGAVLISAEESELEPSTPSYVEISRDEIAAFARRESDGMADLQVESKLSLAGAQSKMGVRIRESGGETRYFLPHGRAASSHIIKTANRRFEMLSENEHYCMKLAATCGIKTPHTFVDMVQKDVPLFVIERYDRTADESSGEVSRLHQEDFCQALGLLPEDKYEQPGRSYLRLVSELIARNSSRPAEDMRGLFTLMAFNVLIGNCDGHLKNISFLCDESWSSRSLAPAYDLASTVIYGGLDRHFALRVGSTSKIDQMCRSDFEKAAEEARMSRKAVLAILDETAEAVVTSSPDMIEELEDVLHKKLEKLHAIQQFSNQKALELGSCS